MDNQIPENTKRRELTVFGIKKARKFREKLISARTRKTQCQIDNSVQAREFSTALSLIIRPEIIGIVI